MAIQQEHPVPIDISDELRTSFMDYAMSVIISRALPDVRDGLKPVHRRILTTLAGPQPYGHTGVSQMRQDRW